MEANKGNYMTHDLQKLRFITFHKCLLITFSIRTAIEDNFFPSTFHSYLWNNSRFKKGN